MLSILQVFSHHLQWKMSDCLCLRTQGDGHSCDLATYQDAGSVDSAGSFTSKDYMEIEANIYEDSCHCVLPSDYINQKEEDGKLWNFSGLPFAGPD